MSFEGYLAVGVPGQLAGMWTAYQNFGGGVNWSSLVEPTIRLCEEGYSVSSSMARALASNVNYIKADPPLREYHNEFPYDAYFF